jgi:hypothetical protein
VRSRIARGIKQQHEAEVTRDANAKQREIHARSNEAAKWANDICVVGWLAFSNSSLEEVPLEQRHGCDHT